MHPSISLLHYTKTNQIHLLTTSTAVKSVEEMLLFPSLSLLFFFFCPFREFIQSCHCSGNRHTLPFLLFFSNCREQIPENQDGKVL